MPAYLTNLGSEQMDQLKELFTGAGYSTRDSVSNPIVFVGPNNQEFLSYGTGTSAIFTEDFLKLSQEQKEQVCGILVQVSGLEAVVEGMQDYM